MIYMHTIQMPIKCTSDSNINCHLRIVPYNKCLPANPCMAVNVENIVLCLKIQGIFLFNIVVVMVDIENDYSEND